jgi:hypothetical protein
MQGSIRRQKTLQFVEIPRPNFSWDIELNTRYEVLCFIAILLDKPQPTYTYTDAKYAIRKEGKPAGNAGNAG